MGRVISASMPALGYEPTAGACLHAPKDEGCVRAAEAERIGNGDVDLHRACGVGHIVEVTLRDLGSPG